MSLEVLVGQFSLLPGGQTFFDYSTTVFDIFWGAHGLLLASPGLLWVGFGGVLEWVSLRCFLAKFLLPERASRRKLRNA